MESNNTEKYSLTWFIYVLECTDNKYYVGITYDIKRRLRKHFRGKKGAVFTKIYRPLKCVELLKLPTESRDEAELYENYKTIEYAVMYGSENVAGGNFIARDSNSRKRGIDNAIKKNKLIVHGKQYTINDEKILLKLTECRISELNGLCPEEISETILIEQEENNINSNSNIQICLPYDKVEPLIAHIDCLKHKTLVAMSLIYKNKPGRMAKVLLCDINRKEMTISVPRKKNSTIAPMELGLLDLIEKYYKAEAIKPKDFLFKGKEEGHRWGCGNSATIISEIKKQINILNRL